MKYLDDRGGSKWLFITILVVFLYCSFFNFNIPAAYEYAVKSIENLFQQF